MIYGALWLILGAIVTAALCLVAWWTNRHVALVEISPRFFIAMGIGSIVIGVFYLGVYDALKDGHIFPLARVSRYIWWFILISTSMMALSVIRWRNGWRGGGGGNDK